MTNEMKIASIYVNFSGDTTPTAEEMYPYLEMAENFGSAAATAKIIEDGTLGDLLFGNTLSNADKVTTVFQGLFGRDPLQAGLDYWVDQLENNGAYVNETSMAQAILRGAEANDDQTDWDNITAAAADLAADLAAYTPDNGGSEVEGQTYYLTQGQDILTGTDDNDTFVARGNSSLDNADIIDGGAGTDTVEVMLDNNETAESPLLKNIEIIEIQAQATTTDSGDNDVDASDLPNADIEANIDAGDMSSVHTYINDNSRADLTIEDVSHNSHVTTLEMRETDMGDVDYNVFFDPENITAPGTADSGATLLIKLANVYNIAESENPVDNFATLSFAVGGTTVSVDVSDATSYDDVVDAIEAAIDAAGLSGLEVTKQADAPAYFSIDVEGYSAGQLAGSYNPILITNNGSGDLTPGTISVSEDATNANMTNTMTNVEGSTIPSLTQVDVVFDRVGRDSKGGDFIAGSDSTGKSGSAGIEQFNVEVDRSSWLTSVSSTNNTLEVLNIENISENSDGKGSLRIDSVTDVRVIDASSMEGSANITADLTSAVTTKYLDLQDTQADNAADNSDDNFLNVVDTYFSYDFGSNDDTFNLTIDGSNLAEAGTTTREDFVLEINGNDGDDTITTSIGTMTAAGYANHKENANLTIEGGKGNDTITTSGEGDWTINAGTGNDTVYSDNSGDKANWAVNAATGGSAAVAEVTEVTVGALAAGETYIFDGLTITDQGAGATAAEVAAVIAGGIDANLVVTGSLATTTVSVSGTTATYTATAAGATPDLTETGTAASSVVTVTTQGVDAVAGTVDVADLDSNGAGNAGILYKAQLTVTYSGALGVNTEAAEAYNEGFESTVTIPTESYLGDQASINQAIKDAINNDEVLNKLLVVKDGPANTLVITSLVDGVHASDDIEITIDAATYTDLSVSEQNALQSAYQELLNDSSATLTQTVLDNTASAGETAAAPTLDDAGTAASNQGSDNIIDLGNGQDVVVLSTDSNSAETLVFTGTIGENTVVNFTLGTGSDGDFLDFTSYLTDMFDTGSGSNVSQDRIATTITVDGAGSINLTSNEITIVNDFAQDLGAAGTADDETWANMTAQDIDDALTAGVAGIADTYGNITDGATSANANLVGSTQTSILMVENDLNDGEYKVFEVTETVANGAYEVNLLGTVDFGDTIDNSAQVTGA